MTLSDLANFICGKVNLTDAEDIAACKGFLTRRHEMIWRDQLWKDSLVEWAYTLPASYSPNDNWMPDKNVLLLPSQIDRVIALRTDVRSLAVRSGEFFYQTDLNMFTSKSAALQYTVLPAAVAEIQSPVTLELVRASADDAAVVAQFQYLDISTNQVSQQKVTLAQALTTFDAGDRIDSFSKGSSVGSVSLQSAFTADILSAGSQFTQVSGLPSFYVMNLTLVKGQTYVFKLGNATQLYRWGNANPLFDPPDESYTSDATFTAGGTDYVLNGPVYGGTNPVPPLTFTGSLLAQRFTIATLGTTATAAAKCQRLRLMGVIDSGVAVRVLGKAIPPSFSDDNDTPGINGMENALIAFAQADMLERERHYAKAAQVAQQAMALLDQLKRVEVVQMANNKTIQPAEGYGNPYDLYSHPPLSF